MISSGPENPSGKRQTCWRCRENKKKCTGIFPCARCVTQNSGQYCTKERPAGIETVGDGTTVIFPLVEQAQEPPLAMGGIRGDSVGQQVTAPGGMPRDAQHNGRKKQTCWRCRENKKKCSGSFPCSRCMTQNVGHFCSRDRPLGIETVGSGTTVTSFPTRAPEQPQEGGMSGPAPFDFPPVHPSAPETHQPPPLPHQQPPHQQPPLPHQQPHPSHPHPHPLPHPPPHPLSHEPHAQRPNPAPSDLDPYAPMPDLAPPPMRHQPLDPHQGMEEEEEPLYMPAHPPHDSSDAIHDPALANQHNPPSSEFPSALQNPSDVISWVHSSSLSLRPADRSERDELEIEALTHVTRAYGVSDANAPDGARAYGVSDANVPDGARGYGVSDANAPPDVSREEYRDPGRDDPSLQRGPHAILPRR